MNKIILIKYRNQIILQNNKKWNKKKMKKQLLKIKLLKTFKKIKLLF